MERETESDKILKERFDKLNKEAKDNLIELLLSTIVQEGLTKTEKKAKVKQIVRQHLK